MIGPANPVCDSIHAEKYRGEGEVFKEAMSRVAAALQDCPTHYHEFREILFAMRFLPAGRVQAAMGSLKNVTPYNCFVAPTILDTFCDGPDSIMGVAHKGATTMRQGGGIGYAFSTLRPKGDLIRGVQATTDGPLAFMPIYNAVCQATSSAGNRRGALMGVLRIDHPDIEAFIHAKQTAGAFTGFNFSVAVTDEFMEAVIQQKPFDLKFNGTV
jgi:ribonucleoside-diphosphate reductase alpha chain